MSRSLAGGRERRGEEQDGGGGFLSLDPFIWPTLLPASPGHTVHVEKQIERERGRVAHQ